MSESVIPEDPRVADAPLSEALIAEDPNAATGKDVEREQMLAALHSRMFGATQSVRLGRFELGARRGAGAMGVVYEALDPDLDRKVALKVLRSSALDPCGVDRFVLEARALAKLRHPNVVTVYEVGTDGEDRFIVMDLVQGETLRDWMETPRDWRAVVRMFIGAGRGLQAAHDAGLVHRDFKPDNVLVEDELPRVVDFGLAAGADDPLTSTTRLELEESAERARYTQTGAFVGTPVYMAPEQARGEATPAADQYAFCVALFEALEGRRPHADAEAAGLDALLVAREEALPPGLPANAPRWLRKVIARGLSPDPAERWRSINDLLLALARVDGRRGRTTAVVAGGLVLTTAAVSAGSLSQDTATRPCAAVDTHLEDTWSPTRRAELQEAFAQTQLPYAAETWDRVAPRLDAYAEDWTEAAQRACVADLAAPDPAPPLNLARHRCIERRRSDFSSLLATFGDADVATVDRAIDAAAAMAPLSNCDDASLLREQLERGDRHRVAPPGLYERVASATVAFRIGDDVTALQQADEALQGAKAVADEELTAEALLIVSEVHLRAGRLEQAAASVVEAIEAAERLGDTRLRARTRLQLLSTLTDRGEFEAGSRQVRFIRASLLRLEDPPTMLLEHRLLEAWLAHRQGSVEQALELFRDTETLARSYETIDTNRLGRVLAGQGMALAELGRYEESLAVQQRAVKLLAERLGTQTPRVIEARMGVATAMSNAGHTDDAFEAAQSAVRDALRVTGDDSVLTASCRATLATAYAAGGKLSEAEPLLRAATVVLERELGPDNAKTAYAWMNFGRVLVYLDKPVEAIEVLDHAAKIMSVTLPPSHTDFIYIHTNLAEAHLVLEHWQAAADAARRAETIVMRSFAGDNGRLVPIRVLQATALRGAGELEASAEVLQAVLEGLAATTARPALIGEAEYELALTRMVQGKTVEATQRMKHARAAFEQEEIHKLRVAAIDTWLAEH